MAPPQKKRRVRPVVPEQPRPPEPEPPRRAARPPPAPIDPSPQTPPDVLPPDASEPSHPERPAWNLEVGGKDLNVVLGELRSDVGYWVKKGAYNKVRVLRDGKQVLPDIPVGALMAVEVASLAWAGVLRTAVMNVAGRLLFRVELINDAHEHLSAAKEHYAKGDLDEAEAETVRALKVDPRMPAGHLMLGTMAKVRGKPQEALEHFRKARDLDPHGEVGREAELAGRKIDPTFGGSEPKAGA